MVFKSYLCALQGDLAGGTVFDLNTRTPATRIPTGAPDDDRRVLYEIIRTVSSSVVAVETAADSADRPSSSRTRRRAAS